MPRTAQRSLARAARLEQEQRQQAELAQLVVHDLKNPLTVIVSNTSFVNERSSLLPYEREALDDVLSAAQRMQTMLMNLLDLGRGSKDGLPIRPRRFNLSELINDTVGCGRRDRVRVRVDAPSTLLANADPDLISRVLENLLDNAGRYAPEGSDIAVVARHEAERVSFSVADLGPGIPASERMRVFDRYVQLAPDEARATRGLGLAFCRMAVSAHRGTIHVEENAPRGARFVVRLPE